MFMSTFARANGKSLLFFRNMVEYLSTHHPKKLAFYHQTAKTGLDLERLYEQNKRVSKYVKSIR